MMPKTKSKRPVTHASLELKADELLKEGLIIWDYEQRPTKDRTKPIIILGATGGNWDFKITLQIEEGLTRFGGILFNESGSVHTLLQRQAQTALKMAWISLNARDFPTNYDKT